MEKKAIKKLTDFWYYYKYYLLVGIVAVIALAVTVKSCYEKRDYDVNVLFMTHGYSESFYQSESMDELKSVLGGFAPDRNGDGKTDVQVITINYGLTFEQSNSANAARSANLASGKNVLFLLDSQNYEELKAGGFLADISQLGESEYLESDRFDVVGSGLASSVSNFGVDGESYYLCLRVYDEKKAQSDIKYMAQYDAAKTLLTNIINKY